MRLVVDVDQIGRVLRDVTALGHDQRDRVADEPHLVLGKRWARRLGSVRTDGRVPLLLRVRVEVGRSEHVVHTR